MLSAGETLKVNSQVEFKSPWGIFFPASRGLCLRQEGEGDETPAQVCLDLTFP